jgi:hypothetical protein
MDNIYRMSSFKTGLLNKSELTTSVLDNSHITSELQTHAKTSNESPKDSTSKQDHHEEMTPLSLEDKKEILEEFEEEQFDIIEAEVEKKKFMNDKNVMYYSYLVLFIIFLNYTSNQW